MSKKIFNYCLLFSAIAPSLYSKDLDTIYFVKKNDNLSAIAKKFKITVEDILTANDIINPNLIYPGMKLKIIKPKTEASILSAESTSNKENLIKDYELYTVKKNDTLDRIAMKFNTTIEVIINDNSIRNPNLIYPGMKLKITRSQSEEFIPNTVSLSDRETSIKDYKFYTVKKGDTLDKIAIKFDTTIESILNSNNIKNPNLIYPGEILKITLEKKTFKIEVSPNSYVEIYYKGEILGYKNINGKEVLNIKGEQIKTGEEFNVKVYDDKGDIKEKTIAISSKPVTFVTFIDKNNNGQLDIDDELLTEGFLKINNKNISIDTSGKTIVNELESKQTYDIILTAKDKNIINKNFNIKINDEIIYIPIKNNLFSINGVVNISGNGNLKQIYDDLLIRLKNENGDEVSLFSVDENGKFLIEELPPGKYLYDVEYVTPSIIKSIIKNKEVEINGKTFEIPLKLKRNGTL